MSIHIYIAREKVVYLFPLSQLMISYHYVGAHIKVVLQGEKMYPLQNHILQILFRRTLALIQNLT